MCENPMPELAGGKKRNEQCKVTAPERKLFLFFERRDQAAKIKIRSRGEPQLLPSEGTIYML
jgi:hypothetical protein